MLTAHLPSGYLLARGVARPVPWLMPAALVGAVLPDLDMIWFHFVDMGSVHHHMYWPHIPLVWAGIAAVTLPVLRAFALASTGVVFFAAILLHLILDTIAGGVLWAYPVSDTLFFLVTVPATQSHWILSFMVHWTFRLEIAVWLLAGILWVRRGRA
jgi:inner membrane protein